MSFIEFDSVYKRYKMGEITINAADGITFNIEQGEFVVVVGPSGAGKTTLLNILGGMDDCDDGKIRVAGELINDYDRKRLIEYRRYDVGFVFQFYNLVQNLTALEMWSLPHRSARSRCMRRRCLSAWALPIASITSPRSFPAASSSVWRLHARWPKPEAPALR